jgi:hypothetical protein
LKSVRILSVASPSSILRRWEARKFGIVKEFIERPESKNFVPEKSVKWT